LFDEFLSSGKLDDLVQKVIEREHELKIQNAFDEELSKTELEKIEEELV